MDKQQVLDALKPLSDPAFGQSMAELGQVKDVVVKGRDVRMTLALVEDDDHLKAKLEKQARELLANIGAEHVHIRFRRLTDVELADIRAKQSAASGDGLDEMQRRRRAEMQAQPSGVPPLLAPGSKTKFIAVASGKGGVGKSTVTVNLAVALARLGKKVGIMDCDIYGFSVPDMMGLEGAPQLAGDKIIPPERFGVKVISMGFFVEDNSPVIWRGPMLGRMLRNFFNEVEWGEIEYMLLDLPPGTGDVALDVHQLIPHSKEILVTTPHATAAFVAARAGAMAKHTNHDIIGVVENMSWYECPHCGEKQYVFGRGGGARLAAELHAELIAQIPLGQPDNHPSEPDFSPSVYKADSPVGRLYLEAAERVIQKA
jgi:ATP-binding protein involved in chromosome partitioning